MSSTIPKRLEFPPGLTASDFLREFWQRRPLLMRDALPGLRSPLRGADLAGLAGAPRVESRLVLERGVRPWEVRHGPFDEALFAALPESHWTLQVRDVDKLVPEVALLLDHFDFLPLWRLDDITFSLAADQGSVGPQVDAVDVFVIQAEGRHRWRIDPHPDPAAPCVPGLDLPILAHFQAQDQWVLAPGDCLYLPAGVPHWGIAEGPGLTWSVALRAPLWQELAGAWCDHAIRTRLPQARYRDPDPQPHHHRGEVPASVLTQIRRRIEEALGGADDEAFAAWFGAHLSRPKEHLAVAPAAVPLTALGLHALIERRGGLARGPSRVLFSALDQAPLLLFVGGETHRLPSACRGFAQLLCESHTLEWEQLAPWLEQPACLEVLCTLYNHGHYGIIDCGRPPFQ